MIDFTIEIEIAQPRDQVFAYVTDPAKLPTWQTNTLSAAPTSPGHCGSGGGSARSTVVRAGASFASTARRSSACSRGLVHSHGGGRIRTCEGRANAFTARPL
jgi:hypothetical protein